MIAIDGPSWNRSPSTVIQTPPTNPALALKFVHQVLSIVYGGIRTLIIFTIYIYFNVRQQSSMLVCRWWITTDEHEQGNEIFQFDSYLKLPRSATNCGARTHDQFHCWVVSETLRLETNEALTLLWIKCSVADCFWDPGVIRPKVIHFDTKAIKFITFDFKMCLLVTSVRVSTNW